MVVTEFPKVMQVGDGRTLDEIDRDELRSLVVGHGAVIVRGARVDLHSFARLAGQLCDRRVATDYEATRSFGQKPLYGSTQQLGYFVQGVDVGNHEIPPHAENSFFPPERPDLGLFWAKKPAAQRGRTTLVDCCTLFATLKPGIRKLIESLQLRWHSLLGYEAFAAYYGTSTKAEFESRVLPTLRATCADEGTTLDADCAADLVSLTFTVPALCVTRRGRAITSSFAFGNRRAPVLQSVATAGTATTTRMVIDRGKPRPPSLEDSWVDSQQTVLEPLFRELLSKASLQLVRPQWQAGDVMLLDNWSALHGREGFDVGDAREVLTSWGKTHWLRPRRPGVSSAHREAPARML